ncbi:MAG: 50S ribosomal protein L21 [Phycisphaerae bacterium]
MYAVIEDSGQQFRVCEGDELNVDLRDLPEDTKELTFDRVLLVSGDDGIKVGTPLLDGAKVTAEVVKATVKGEKVYNVKFRRRKGSRVKKGHRQKYTQVKVTRIEA